MEDRLQKVLEKKKVKNNYKHIEVLPTLNDNTSTDTTVNIENPSPSVTSSTKTVQSDKSESSTSTGKNKKPKESVIENFETGGIYNIFEKSNDYSKIEKKAKVKCRKLGSRMRNTLKNFVKNVFIVVVPIFLIVLILCATKTIIIDATIDKTIRADDIFKSKKFWIIGIALSIMIGISVSYDDGSSKYGDSLSIKRLKKFKGWQQLFVSIADSIKKFFNFISELLFLAFRGDCKHHKNDVTWIRRSTFEFFSIIMAYTLTKYLYFIDESTAKSYYQASEEYGSFAINNTVTLFSKEGPILFYRIAKQYWSEFIKKIGLEPGYIKFIVLFILAVILVYTAIPYFLSCIVKTFEWKVSPSIYYLILIGFILHLIPDESKKVAALSGGFVYIFLLLILLLLHFVIAPLTQLILVGYIIYYFLHITVKEGDDGDSLNNKKMNNLFDRDNDNYFSIKPENVQMTVEKPKVLNFIWWCYLLFFLWKLIELIAFYAISRNKNITALSGVKSDSCFGVFLAITILAIIIMIAIWAKSGTGEEKNDSTIMSESNMVDNPLASNAATDTAAALAATDTAAALAATDTAAALAASNAALAASNAADDSTAAAALAASNAATTKIPPDMVPFNLRGSII